MPPPYFKGSLFVPTLLSLALISAFSSSALANSGGNWSAEKNAYSKWDTLTGNNIVIDETLPGPGSVYGAYTEEDNQVVSGNTVTVTVSDPDKFEVVGGSAGDGGSIGAGYANENAVFVSYGSTSVSTATGGRVTTNSDGNATSRADKNTVTISRLSTVQIVYSGHSSATAQNGTALADANDNTVTVSNSNVKDGVFGGNVFAYSSNGNATSRANRNTITIKDNSIVVNGTLAGGHSIATADNGEALAEANNNTVNISQSVIGSQGLSNLVSGGYASADTALANDNTVTISNSYFSENVISGSVLARGTVSAVADASNNTLIIDGSKSYVGGSAMGGYIQVELENNGTATATANNNTVVVSGGAEIGEMVAGGSIGDFDHAYGGIKLNAGGTANAYANDNTVSVLDSKVVDGVVGGYISAGASGEESATVNVYANNNTVTISNSKVSGYVMGAVAFADSDDDKAGAFTAYANNNTVTISNSKVSGDVLGGYVDAGGGNTNIEQASYNTVIIDSAEVSGDAVIAGGLVCANDPTDSHTATYNTVNIGGDYAIENVSLYGAYVVVYGETPSVNGDFFTGNTLNFDASLKTNTTTVGEVANFETINIKVGDVTNGAIILNAKGGAILGDGNSKGTTVNLLSVDTGNLDAGNYITLISNADGTLANEGQKQFVPIGNSIALGYIGQTNLETDGVVFNIEGKGVTPKTKVLNESRAAEMAFLNSAADLLQDQDIHKAGKHVFGAVRGIYNKYKTGSSVDISGMGLVTGVANTWAGDSSDLTGAVFVEAGWGSFDTKNDIMGSVQRGDGDSYYYGTGLIGKYDVTQGLFSGLYAEAAAHVGIISTDYSNAGLSSLTGQTASYDTDSLYYAAATTPIRFTTRLMQRQVTVGM